MDGRFDETKPARVRLSKVYVILDEFFEDFSTGSATVITIGLLTSSRHEIMVSCMKFRITAINFYLIDSDRGALICAMINHSGLKP